jgi:hypothetical protein
VQYGIENLSSHVLKLMDKGVTAVTNVRVMRDNEDHHLTVKWNYLYGFPGEQPADYLSVIEQMPALTHLQPPMDACRIALERFSPYFDRPELGFGRRSPAEFYRYVYDLPDGELMDLAYFFDTDNHGINGEAFGPVALRVPCRTRARGRSGRGDGLAGGLRTRWSGLRRR